MLLTWRLTCAGQLPSTPQAGAKVLDNYKNIGKVCFVLFCFFLKVLECRNIVEDWEMAFCFIKHITTAK